MDARQSLNHYDSSIRNELIKIIEKLPLDTVEKVKNYLDKILPETAPLSMETILAKREEILDIGRRNGVINIAVFGSVVRGDASGGSDVDFLVDMEKGRSLLDLSGFMVDMEELLGYRVDVALRSGLKEMVRDEILKEAVLL